MAVTFTKADKQALHRIHLILGQNMKTTRELLESLAIYAILEHSEGREVVLPLLGRLSFTYKGDVVTRQGREAVVDTSVDLADFMTRNIGQIEDGVLTDAEALLLERVKSVFVSYEEDTLFKDDPS